MTDVNQAAEEWSHSIAPALQTDYHRTKHRESFKAGAQWQREQDQREIAELRDALEGLLRDASLDWYVAHFHQSEAPTASASGIAATIGNHERTQRAAVAYERARQALAPGAKARAQGEK